MRKQRTRRPRLDENLQEKSSLVKGEQLLRLSTKSLAAKSLAVQRGCQKNVKNRYFRVPPLVVPRVFREFFRNSLDAWEDLLLAFLNLLDKTSSSQKCSF